MKKYRYLILLLIIVISAGAIILVAHERSGPQSRTATTGTKSSQTTRPSTASAQPDFDKSRYSTTDPTSPWIVVNKQHPLNPISYAPPDLTSVGNGQYMRAEAAQALKAMLAGASTAGYTVTAASGYRSYDTQVSVYNSEVKNYGQATADSESARPGYSEHQTGWAVDLASDGCSITDCFGTTPGGKWVSANAYKYGFLLRYTPDNTTITGYRSEAWHYRYIGVYLSTELHNENVTTLEQFFNISGGPNYN